MRQEKTISKTSSGRMRRLPKGRHQLGNNKYLFLATNLPVACAKTLRFLRDTISKAEYLKYCSLY